MTKKNYSDFSLSKSWKMDNFVKERKACSSRVRAEKNITENAGSFMFEK